MQKTLFQQYRDTLYKKQYKLSEVKDKIEKVAFDVVKFKDDDDASKLWQIHSSDDGDYIVALYDVEQVSKIAQASENPWTVKVSNLSGTISVFYKDTFITQLKATDLGIPKEELSLIKSYLPKKLQQNKKLVSLILQSSQTDVLSKFPELQ